MKANHGYFRRILLAAASGAALSLLPQIGAASPKAAAQDFAGAFIVEHVSTLHVETGMIQVDVVGGGCVTGAAKAYCDNHATQMVEADGSGTATYTLYLPGGSVALKLTFEPGMAGGDPMQGIRFGGSFVVVANSGTAAYKHATGSGTWSGGAEFSGPLVPGANPPGPGRWAFWGTLNGVAK